MSNKITLRTATGEDEEFLYSVYCSTRADEVSEFGWDPAQAEAFLRMQFAARQRGYRMQFPTAGHSIIMLGESCAGGLIVERTDGHILLTDIAVLTEYRRNGIATYILNQLQEEAAAALIPLILRVDKTNNAAEAFYKKRGFGVGRETDILLEMIWDPAVKKT